MTEHNENGFVHDPEHRLEVVAGGTIEAGAHFENGFLKDADGRVIVIGPNGTSLGFVVFEEDKTWTIGPTVQVPVGDTGYIPPFIVTHAAGQTVSLARAWYRINSGTSVTVDLERNGTPIPGFEDIAVTTMTSETNPADVELTEGDVIAPVVTAVAGSPKNMTFQVVLKHTAD